MSLDVRKITNGKENFIYVRDELKDENQVTLYRSKEEVPFSIRHYVHDDSSFVLWGPDMARLMGAQHLLYPDLVGRKCGLDGYVDTFCIFESCGCTDGDSYENCKYIKK